MEHGGQQGLRGTTKLRATAALAALGAAWPLSLAAADVSFATDIEPVLRERCQICHGAALQQSSLRLDRREGAMRGGASGPAVVPGDSAASALVQRLEGANGLARMPPGDALPPSVIATIRAWIDQGAEWSERTSDASEESMSAHWAFRPVGRPEVPAVRRTEWVRNPIDAFVLARLEREGLEPSAEAEPHALRRRVHLDLTGLPPAPADLSEPATHEAAVERLLESEHYGERWASAWLDQVRYADSDGYEKDSVRPHAWRYRHWVIDALNRDMPFDRFTVEQIAGDLLPGATPAQKVATGFHRNTLKNREGGVNVEQFRFEEVVDRTNTVATVWLGLSMECARCHDHKYDPVTQREYYRLLAFFNGMDEVNIDAPLPGEVGPFLRAKAGHQRRLAEIYEKYRVRELQAPWERKMLWARDNPGVEHEWDTSWDIVALYLDRGQRIIETPRERRDWRDDFALTEWFLGNYNRVTTDEEYDRTGFRDALKEVRALAAEFPDVSRARAVRAADRPRPTSIHPSGEWDDLGDEVSAGTPAVLPAAAGTTRLDLARWLVDDGNPLTPRVTVNRLWQEYFGSGLVATADNFGLRAEPPSHPDLLDWLAAEFVESGWSLKHVHRLIATSATYRQSSAVREDLSGRDPANRLLARQSRLRLPAETIRDASLAASGLLNPAVGGPSVRPPQPPGVAELGYASGVKWEPSAGSAPYRRGIYIHFQRTTPYPFLANFDLMERNVARCSRERSNTPLQALNLLNDPVFFEMAQGLAFRVLTDLPEAPFPERLRHLFLLALSRPPRAAEQEEMLRYFVQQRALLEAEPGAAGRWLPAAIEHPDGIVDPLDAGTWVGISRIALNLDEFITRE